MLWHQACLATHWHSRADSRIHLPILAVHVCSTGETKRAAARAVAAVAAAATEAPAPRLALRPTPHLTP